MKSYYGGPIGIHLNGTIPTPYGLPFPRLRVRNPNPKLQSLLSQERVKLRTSNLAGTFTGCIRTKAHYKFGTKGSTGVSRDWPNFWSTPIIAGMSKATDFKFGQYIHRVHSNKSRLKILEKRNVGIPRDCPNFFSTPYYPRNG